MLTALEQRFMEAVPVLLRSILSELKTLNKNLAELNRPEAGSAGGSEKEKAAAEKEPAPRGSESVDPTWSVR